MQRLTRHFAHPFERISQKVSFADGFRVVHTMKRSARLSLPLWILLTPYGIGLASCTSDEPWNDPVIYSGVEELKPPQTPIEKLEALDLVLKNRPKLTQDIADVRAILMAETLQTTGDLAEALVQWRNALEKAQGPFGKKALEGWIKAYTQSLGKKVDPQIVARLVLAETRAGESSPYMIANNLTTEAALIPILRHVAPTWLTEDESAPPPTALPPPRDGIPSQDPLLIKTASTHCVQKNLDRTAWNAWRESLPRAVQPYWQALVEQCSGQGKAALAAFEESYSKLVATAKTQGLALEAISRIATLQRSMGRRKEASDTYLTVVKTWNLPGVTSQSIGLDSFELIKRRIDDTLWASRYRALFGDHETAKAFAQDSLDLISSAYTVGSNLSANRKEQLAAFKAEAYHSLAFRIAVQEKEYQSALALTLVGLETPGLATEWRERLQWFAGLYEYLDGQYFAARKRWEILLTQVKDPSQRAMIYFWLARATAVLDQMAESRFYLNAIVEEYPLSFYATIAPAVAGLKTDKAWSAVFGTKANLVKRLQTPRDFGLQPLRQDKEIGRLLRRAEILVKADLRPWGQMALDDLEREMGRTMGPETHPAPYIYLTRLEHRVGRYLKAIALTTKIAKSGQAFWREWPEQLLIYFPTPYRSFFDLSAQEAHVDKQLLYGIARQESGFTPDIRSSAGAVGVMQLIRPTAERFAPDIGIANINLDNALKDPQANIRLGGRYLKALSLTYQGFPPGVYGGYNAGELALDLWIKHRPHPDPLAFMELVPFGETKDYIKGVWRNIAVYQHLDQTFTPP